MGGFDPTARLRLADSSALVCDPKTAEQDIVAAMLNGFGLSKVSRCSDAHGLENERGSGFDLIFVGITAFDQERLEGVRALRQAVDHPSRTSPVVIMSGYTPRTMIEAARNVGATFVIAKPLSSKVVFERILWLASVKPTFVECPGYFGPDRRLRNFGPPLGLPGRRAGDLSAQVGEAKEVNMSQDAIDTLMRPARISL